MWAPSRPRAQRLGLGRERVVGVQDPARERRFGVRFACVRGSSPVLRGILVAVEGACLIGRCLGNWIRQDAREPLAEPAIQEDDPG
jgi:hypothetical protein